MLYHLKVKILIVPDIMNVLVFCVPICNVDMRKMFGDNMLYSTPEEMTKFIEFGEVFQKWKRPNKNIILRNYWELRLRDKINKME